MNSKLVAILKSRKFWASLVGLAFVVLTQYVPAESLPFTQDQIISFVLVIVGYVLSVALEDGLRAR